MNQRARSGVVPCSGVGSASGVDDGAADYQKMALEAAEKEQIEKVGLSENLC